MKPSGLVVAALALGWAAVQFRRGRLGRGAAAGWVLLAAVAAVYGFGVVHPPSAEHIIRSLGTTLGRWTYLLVGLLAFLETGAFVGLIAPGETAILLGGFVAGQGKISVVALLAIVWGAAVAGDLTSFLLGRRLGREFLLKHGPRVKITADRLEKVEEFFDRRGGMAILLGRFIGFVRAVQPFVAGASRMSLARFLPYDIVGAGIWGCGLVLLGYAFWQSFDTLLRVAKQGALGLGLAIAVIAGVVAAARFLREEENRRLLSDRLEQHPVGRKVVLPAGRLAASVAPGRFGIEVMTLLAVVLVGAFTCAALIAALHPSGSPLALDTDVARMVRHLRPQSYTGVLKAVTALGAFPFPHLAAVAAVVWLAGRGRGPEAAALAAGIILAVLAYDVMKPLVDRPRPPQALVPVSGRSFPSGHAAGSMLYVAIGVVLARPAPGFAARVGLVLAGVGVAAVIGATRVMLGVHWASDVLAGWGLGAAVFGTCGLVALLVMRRRNNGVAA